jgi:hypothetical protein
VPQAAGGVASAGLDSVGFVSALLVAGFWLKICCIPSTAS